MITKAIVRQLGFSALAAVAAGLAVPAAASTVDRVEADGAYSLNGGAVVPLQQGLPTNPVDVVVFTGADKDSAALHSYGSSSGFFGTRSSGGGTYDVTSAFHIAETITNDSAYAQVATFTFTIAPGLIMNAVGSPLSGGDFVKSGLVFAVKRDGVLKFGSEATLTTTFAGTTFLSSGANLYAPSGGSYGGDSNYYTINGLTMTVSLGTIAAGASFDFTYDLSSFASARRTSASGGMLPAAATTCRNSSTKFRRWPAVADRPPTSPPAPPRTWCPSTGFP